MLSVFFILSHELHLHFLRTLIRQIRPRAVMSEFALPMSCFSWIWFHSLACMALPSPPMTTPPARRPQKRSSPNDPSLSGGVIAICAIGGLVLIAAAFTIYWLLQQREDKASLSSHQGLKYPSFDTSTSTSSFLRSEAPMEDQSQHIACLSHQSQNTLIPYDLAIESSAFEPLRGKSKHGRNGSQGKSVGGIYELPASPRRILIPGEWSDECSHTWTGGKAPRDSRYKMLPEIPGEGRRWI